MNWDPAAARTATKTCLAFGLALAGALYLNWPVTPAVITAQMLQASLLGIAVRNSITRFLGACLAGFISLVMLGLFPDDRFALVLTYGFVTAFAVYMFQRSTNPYFWMIVSCGIPFIGMASGAHPLNTFHQAVAIPSAFMLGGAAVILVNELLWPNPVTRVFEDAFAKTLHGIQQHFDLRRRALVDGDASHAADEQKLQARLLESTAMLPTLVRNAAVETRQMGRFSDNYLRLMDDVTVMGAEVVSLGDMLAPCLASETLRPRLAGSLALKAGLGRFVAELGALAEQVRAERDGSLRIDAVPSPDLAAGLELTALGDGGDRALVEAMRRKARDAWSAIGAVRQALANVENPRAPPVAIMELPKKEPFSFNSFRFRWSVLVGLASILGAYLWLIPQWPGGLKIAITVPVIGCMMIHQWPGVQRAIFTGLGLAIGISWVLYFVVLPPLPNDFWLLWPTMMLFLFPLVYLQALKNPFWATAGFIGGFSFCVMVSVSHFQQYSFSSFIEAVTGLVGALGFAVAFFTIVQRKPPEQEFPFAVGAFFGLCESILREFEDLANQPDAIRTLRTRRRALTAAWQNCAGLAHRLPYSRVPQNDQQKVGEFMEALWSIKLRLDAMIRERIRYVAGGMAADQGGSVRRSLAEVLAALRNAAQHSEAVHESLPDFTSHLEFTEALQAPHLEAESDRGSPDAAGVRLALAGLHWSLLEAVQTARQRFNLLDWKAWSFERF